MLPRTFVVLATVHLDHYPGNTDSRKHDRGEHSRQPWATPFYCRSLGDLFTGLYR